MYVMICANKGVRVLVAGLEYGFKGKSFSDRCQPLMATAEYVTKVQCYWYPTGNLANYSFRKIFDDKLVLLARNELMNH